MSKKRKRGRGERVKEERRKEEKKDVTGWTVVTRNKRLRRIIQIFVKVDESRVTTMEVSLTDVKVEDVMRQIQKDEDVYVTMHGRVLRRNEKLKSCGVTDGCTIQVVSRMRRGGRHKDKKSKVEKKQVTRQEPVKNEGPAILESDKDAVIWMLPETDEYRKIVEDVLGGSDIEVERKMQYWATALQVRTGVDIEGDGMWTQMGGGSKEKRKARRARVTAAGQGRATAAQRARAKWAARGRTTATGGARTNAIGRTRAKLRTGAKQASAFRSRRSTEGDEGGEHRRIGGDRQIGGGTDRQRKFKLRPRER